MNAVQSIEDQLRRGPRTSAELAAVAGVSIPTVTRAVSSIPAAFQMGRARAARYGLADAVRGMAAQAHPVYRVGHEGEVAHIGTLTAIVGGGFWYENLEAPTRSREFASIPWFLQDLRPQGFLGRATVRHFAARGWPADLALWSERDVLASILQSAAHDHIGNLLIGDRALLAYNNFRHPLHSGLPADDNSRIQRYRDMVLRMGDDAVAGTSVNGEQPKFCADVAVPDSNRVRHVLVKFTAPVNTEAGQRWSDLLVMEARCLDSIRTGLGIPAASAQWLTASDRAFLEIDRFDRSPAGGREGVISFASLDAEFVGLGSNWTRVARQLAADGHLHEGAVRTIEVLEFFAALIGNSDRHLGNLSVHFGGARPMQLTPIYDFLPMRYAPTSLGMTSDPLTLDDLPSPENTALDVEDRRRAVNVARQFWEDCGQDSRISLPMRQVCLQNAGMISRSAAH